MNQLAKLAAVGLLAIGLSACDNGGDAKTAGNAPAATESASATTNNEQVISLLDGKLRFTLPAGINDRSGTLGTQANNMHVYADESGRQAVIVILNDDDPKPLDELMQGLEDLQRSRDANLQVITNKAIEISGQPFKQLDSVITVGNVKSYSSIVLGRVGGKLMTWQVTLPAEDQQQAQSIAEKIIGSMAIDQ